MTSPVSIVFGSLVNQSIVQPNGELVVRRRFCEGINLTRRGIA